METAKPEEVKRLGTLLIANSFLSSSSIVKLAVRTLLLTSKGTETGKLSTKQVSKTTNLSVDDKSFPAIVPNAHVCPLTQVRC
jgi:hypothetical protein